VATPRSVELHKNILFVVYDNVLVVVGDNGNNRSIVLLRNWLRLNARLDLTSKKVIDEFGNVLFTKLGALLERKLLVLGCILNGKGRPFADLKVQVLSVLSEGLGVNSRNVNLSLVLCGNGLECFG